MNALLTSAVSNPTFEIKEVFFLRKDAFIEYKINGNSDYMSVESLKDSHILLMKLYDHGLKFSGPNRYYCIETMKLGLRLEAEARAAIPRSTTAWRNSLSHPIARAWESNDTDHWAVS